MCKNTIKIMGYVFLYRRRIDVQMSFVVSFLFFLAVTNLFWSLANISICFCDENMYLLFMELLNCFNYYYYFFFLTTHRMLNPLRKQMDKTIIPANQNVGTVVCKREFIFCIFFVIYLFIYFTCVCLLQHLYCKCIVWTV